VLSRDPNGPDGNGTARTFVQYGNVQMVGWDGCTARGWGHLLTPACAVVNLAGASPAHWRWTTRYKERIRQSRLHAAAAVAQAIEHYGPPEVLIQASASGYYGNRGDEVLTESSAPGSGFRADMCQAVEASVASVATRCCIVRTGIVLDRHRGALPPLLLFARMFGSRLGDGRQWIPWVYRSDVACAIRFLIKQRTLSGPFNVCAPTPAPNRDFLRIVHRVFGHPAMFALPAVVLRAVLGEMATVTLDSQHMVPERLLASGFAFAYPQLDRALRQLPA
jgi:uncharacterized protein